MSLAEIKRKLGKGPMSEVGLQPIGAYAPVGSQRSVDERTYRIDLLADKVAEVVKTEVNRFFEGET